MRRFGVVLLAGFVGGTLCGFLTLIPQFYGAPHYGGAENPVQEFMGTIVVSLFLGIEFGGPFGLIAFPLCYYLFLRAMPLRLILVVTIAATTLAAWLGLLLPTYKNHLADVGIVSWFSLLYGPAFVGLLVSSVALSFWGRRTRVQTDQSRP